MKLFKLSVNKTDNVKVFARHIGEGGAEEGVKTQRKIDTGSYLLRRISKIGYMRDRITTFVCSSLCPNHLCLR